MKAAAPSTDSGFPDGMRSDDCARYLKALADAERLRIVQALQDGPKNVGELAALLGRDLASISHHLKVLLNAELVQNERQGKFIFYSLHRAIAPHSGRKGTADCLDLGCCRIEWGNR